METLKINMLADSRTAKIVDENLEAITGLVTLFKDVPVLIELALFDMEGKPFATEALNSYEWGFVIANDYNKATAPQLRANAVTVAGNTLKIEIDNMNTVELNTVLLDEKSIRLGAELTGKKDGVDNWVIQFNVSIRNRRDSIGTPTPVQRDYYTKPETDKLIADNVVGAENTVVESFNVAANVENGILTYETEGRILQVIDDQGEIIYPDISLTQKDNKLYSTLQSNVESITGFWTIYKIIGAMQFTELDLTPYQLKKDTFDGDYNHLANKPTIPSKTSELTNDSGFVTAADIPQGDGWNKIFLDSSTITNTTFTANDKDWFVVNTTNNLRINVSLPATGTVRVTNHGFSDVFVNGYEMGFGFTCEWEYLKTGTLAVKVIEFCKAEFSNLRRTKIRGKILGFDQSYNLVGFDQAKNYIGNLGANNTNINFKDGFVYFTRLNNMGQYEFWINPLDYASEFEQNFEIDLTLDYDNIPLTFNPVEYTTWLDSPDFSKAGTYRICYRYNANTNKYFANVAYFIGVQ